MKQMLLLRRLRVGIALAGDVVGAAGRLIQPTKSSGEGYGSGGDW